MNHGLGERPDGNLGLLLVGHGTRDPVGIAQFMELAATLARRAAPLPVEACLLELSQPDVAEGWRRLATRGVRQVRVLPLLLFTAGHARSDIPATVAAAAEKTPGISFSQARPLSRHPRIIELVIQRIGHAPPCLGDSAAENRREPEGVDVVMVGRGSYDPCARSDMLVLSEIVRHRLGLRRIHTAFYAMTEPRLPEVLDAVAKNAGGRRIIVYPHLLFEGHLNQAIHGQVAEAARRHQGTEFFVAPFLGPDPQVAEALWGRARQ